MYYFALLRDYNKFIQTVLTLYFPWSLFKATEGFGLTGDLCCYIKANLQCLSDVSQDEQAKKGRKKERKKERKEERNKQTKKTTRKRDNNCDYDDEDHDDDEPGGEDGDECRPLKRSLV